MAGKIAGQDPAKLYVGFGRFFSISLDICVRLGSRLVWYKKTSVCFSGLQRGHQENIWEKDSARARFACMMDKLQISAFGDGRQAQMDVSGPRGPRLRAMLKITWLEELASESNIIQAQEDITQPGKTACPDRRKL